MSPSQQRNGNMDFSFQEPAPFRSTGLMAVEPAALFHVAPPLSPSKRPRTVVESEVPLRSPDKATGSFSFSSDLAKALKSVVKVFTTTASPNHGSPWQMQSQTKSTASGFVISPLAQRRILTNAHAVSNQLQVMLRKHGNAKKFTAKVLAVGHECDIAMLTVEDDEFWEGVEPLEINGVPNMQENVMVVGFPQGGDNVCVTKGVVSRLDRQQYSHGRTSLLAVQIDAAINSGNSGGPVLLGDKVVGIAFQCLTSGENIGYIIPVPVINHFLEDLKRHGGKYTGFCELGCSWQNLENADFKRFLGMPKNTTGVLVTATEPLFHASKVLKEGDVITSLNGHPLADDGTFLYQQSVRIDFRHLVSMHFQDETCQLGVWRNGELLDVNVRLSTPKHLVPIHSHDVKPSYFIYAGLVFTRLTNFYLRSVYGSDWTSKAPIKLCDRSFAGKMEREGQEVVLLSKVLASELNTGYQDISNIQVLKCNGTPVHNLAHLMYLVTTSQDDFVRFDLEWHKVVLVDCAKARDSEKSILKMNSIHSAYSDDMLEAMDRLPADLVGCPAQNDDGTEQESANNDISLVTEVTDRCKL